MTNTPRTPDDCEDEYMDQEDLVDQCYVRPEPNLELEVFDAVRGQGGFPVNPVRLTAEDNFHFRCHKGVSCWNECCHGADITLTPCDILKMSKHLGVRPAEFLAAHTVPATFDKSNLPVAKLKMSGADGKGACAFVGPEGCSIYEARPATCRYYPLGLVSMKMKDAEAKEDFHFIVTEPHCKGHQEERELNVAAYKAEQQVADYERVDRGWIDILMKMASWATLGGPMGKDVSIQTKKMFFMATTDVDAFRRFVLGSRFLESYEIAAEAVEIIKTDDEALLLLGFDWLKNILFNEPTLVLKEQILQGAIAKARQDMGAA
jgi:Fe-S-cluster containining protein